MIYQKKDVLVYPNNILTTPCNLVEEFDVELKEFIDHMFQKMYLYNGIGLAANQVGINKQILIMDIPLSPTESVKEVMINPKMIMHVKTQLIMEEGCLSFPEVRIKTKRYTEMLVEYQNEEGNKLSKVFKGLPAVCVQHEMDHLKGKTFLDFTSDLKKKIITEKLLHDFS